MCGMPPKAAGGVAQRLEVGVGVEASARCIMSEMAEAEVGKVDLDVASLFLEQAEAFFG